ncbi:MAG TPA: hypothetical protein VGP37_08875 [Candidatus Nanopelagicales bacterium]|nr:hypothetical protein [Candidatus Nanopelagicales bacterium]
MPDTSGEFRPREILRTLNEEGVEYVVIGGLAAVFHGSSLPTQDVDVLPARERANLDRLAAALNRLGARIRTAGDAVPTKIDGAFLSAMPLMLNLETDAGDLDVAFEPAGPRSDFDQWNAGAQDLDLGDGLAIRVASLQAIIDSKTAAGRPKDQMALPYLESLRDQLSNTTTKQDPTSQQD